MKEFKKIATPILWAFSIISIVMSCKKQITLPDNPYDQINYGDSTTVEDTLGPNSITALHRDIFFPKCATPGCHDGNFEPNFLTVQSTYSTLVYHPLVKTDSTGYFIYRVHPNDTARSWLHERLTTDDSVLGRMPLYSNPLSQDEMDRINNWIMNGAPDLFGDKAVFPDVQPSIPYYFALNNFTDAIVVSDEYHRIDSVQYNPFITQPDSGFYIFVNVTDDSTDISDMSYNTLKLSTDKNDFSNATEYTATYYNLGGVTEEYWYLYISTSSYSPGDTVYMRYYTNDGKHTENVEMPSDEDAIYYHLFWSFYVKQ